MGQNSAMSTFLYHGFPEPKIAPIESSGLQPNQTSSYRSSIFHGVSNFVYLTDCLAPKYALDTKRDVDNGRITPTTNVGVVRLSKDSLDESLLYPDEVWLRQHMGLDRPVSPTEHINARSCWERSLIESGKVAYSGAVGRGALDLFVIREDGVPSALNTLIWQLSSDSQVLCDLQREVGVQATLAFTGSRYSLLSDRLDCPDGRSCQRPHTLKFSLKCPLNCVSKL